MGCTARPLQDGGRLVRKSASSEELRAAVAAALPSVLYSVGWRAENILEIWFCFGQHTIDDTRPRVRGLCDAGPFDGGHQVIRAGDTEEAARAALAVPVDIVVADSLASDLPAARERLEAMGRRVAFVFVSPSATKWAAPGLPLRDGDRLVRKPASSGELRTAVAELLRAAQALGTEIDLSGVTFDRAGQCLKREGASVQLTPIEFRLLDYLVRVRGSLASTGELLDHVWNYTSGTASSEVVRSHLKNLRAKIRRVNDGRDLIETVPRRGYRLITT